MNDIVDLKLDINLKTDAEIWHEECAYANFLVGIPSLGIKAIDSLHGQYGSYTKIYEALQSGEAYRELLLCGNVSESKVKKKLQIENYVNQNEPIHQYEEMLAERIFCIPKYMEGYPKKLTEIADAPSALYVKGKMPDEKYPLVAIIGARNCSNYGALMAKEIGKKLAENKIGVVSGLARGIDGIGQNAALSNGGATFGILGSGVDICYPEENEDLYQRLANGENRSGIISEFIPNTPAQKNHFPMRNRIISGMADAIVVVEAKEKSGTFITVERALEQGKNVYAMPGRISDRLSFGCNRLISQGAGIIWDLDEFVHEIYSDYNCMNYTRAESYVDCINQEFSHESENVMSTNCTSEKYKEVLSTVDFEFKSVDVILAESKSTDLVDMLVLLSELENMGMIESENGYYRKKI